MKLLEKFIKSTLTEDDFKDAPMTQEPDGVYQLLFVKNGMYTRNVDTGEIDFIAKED